MREGEREVKIILLEEQWWINRFSWRGKDDDNAKFIFCAKNAREEKTMDRWKIIFRPRRRLSKKVRWIGWETDRYVLEKKKKEVFFCFFLSSLLRALANDVFRWFSKWFFTFYSWTYHFHIVCSSISDEFSMNIVCHPRQFFLEEEKKIYWIYFFARRIIIDR